MATEMLIANATGFHIYGDAALTLSIYRKIASGRGLHVGEFVI